MAMPLCVMRSLWQERNKQTFDGIESSVSVLKEHILKTSFAWSHVLGDTSTASFLDFIDSLAL
jgi:hypothetical protein